jgi:hypothetical protein
VRPVRVAEVLVLEMRATIGAHPARASRR